jgi:hypothetical protein
MRYRDPDGRDLVGSDGKAVSYEKDKKTGEVTWSKNATKDIVRVGNAMLYTKTGSKMLDKMISSSVKITLQVSIETSFGSYPLTTI